LANPAVAMYHLQTPLLFAGVCGFILFLTKFYAARQKVWKLQKANVVSKIASKGPRKMTRLMRPKSIANANIQTHCRSLPCAQGHDQGTTAQHDTAHRDGAALEEVPEWNFLYQHVAIHERTFDGCDNPVRSFPGPRAGLGQASRSMRTTGDLDRRAKLNHYAWRYLEEMACSIQPRFQRWLHDGAGTRYCR
jgi:hypothetical protein